MCLKKEMAKVAQAVINKGDIGGALYKLDAAAYECGIPCFSQRVKPKNGKKGVQTSTPVPKKVEKQPPSNPQKK